MNDYRVIALDPSQFAPLFDLDDQALLARGMRRVIADRHPGFPCRVSLVDAEPGEELLLLPFQHLDVDSPYRASGPIYVRRGAERAHPAPGEIPLQQSRRLLSVRAYDRNDLMREAEVCEGTQLDRVIRTMFEDPEIAFLHVHNAKPGCFACRVERATQD